MMEILIAAGIVGGVGIAIGLFLGVAAESFKVEVDETEIAVRDLLPGNNCGGCGYAGCDGLAAAIAKGEAPASACPVGGQSVAQAIGELLGQEVSVEHKVAFVRCAGTGTATKTYYEYTGEMDCRQMMYVPNGGTKSCSYGCTGMGNCVKVCDYDAIHIVDGVAVVDKDKCKACGMCVRECPKGLIEMVPYEGAHFVACNNTTKGKLVREVCSQGCIGCMLCVKNCEAGAITVENNVAHIDYTKCTNCGICVEKCPAKIIL
jgi:electron transport complex protein RnfB